MPAMRGPDSVFQYGVGHCVGFGNENKKGKHSRPACYIVDIAQSEAVHTLGSSPRPY